LKTDQGYGYMVRPILDAFGLLWRLTEGVKLSGISLNKIPGFFAIRLCLFAVLMIGFTDRFYIYCL